jgi:hypothetical protein
MTPEYRKKLGIAFISAVMGVFLVAYGLGVFSSDASQDEAPPENVSSRSLMAYSQQPSDDDRRNVYGMEPIKAKHGALSWDIFAAVGENVAEVPAPAQGGFSNTYTWLITPTFTPEIKKYDGQTVKIMGYMFPLDEGEGQRHFLMGPYPPSCPFDYHSPNNQVIDVKADQPIPFTWEPILVEGRFVLNRTTDQGTFYRLENTRFLKEYPEAATQ